MGFHKRTSGKPDLTFKMIRDTGKTKLWDVLSHTGDNLGQVRWYWPWRRYVFFPAQGTLFDVRCMGQISQHIIIQMDERKKAQKGK